MNKIKEQLNAIGIHNLHNVTKSGHPFISYESADPRACRGPRWVLSVKNRVFKDRAWYENGSVWFSCCSKNKKEILQQALDKVKILFPDLEMVKCMFGGYVPKSDLDEAIAKAKAAYKERIANESKDTSSDGA